MSNHSVRYVYYRYVDMSRCEDTDKLQHAVAMECWQVANDWQANVIQNGKHCNINIVSCTRYLHLYVRVCLSYVIVLFVKAVFDFKHIVAKRNILFCVHIISSAWVFTKQCNMICFPMIQLKCKTAGMNLLGVQGGAHPSQPWPGGVQGVQFFIARQKNIGDIMKYTLYAKVIWVLWTAVIWNTVTW